MLLRNYRRRSGELDLVARDGDVLIVVEVRTRSTETFGGAAASIDGWKRAQDRSRDHPAALNSAKISRGCECASTSS
ncbi:MAG: YraN family protein [Gammaproteobacteria bacterium]